MGMLDRLRCDLREPFRGRWHTKSLDCQFDQILITADGRLIVDGERRLLTVEIGATRTRGDHREQLRLPIDLGWVSWAMLKDSSGGRVYYEEGQGQGPAVSR